ncbi:MAG: DUF169 domain-containing protein [Deltaproteobacteria bacterium]|nr:DUF169 domain-containing protein [Deltaproteobacteria bacterium]
MEELKRAYEVFREYLMPQSFPIAIKMLAEGDPIPEEARRPFRDIGRRFSTCQGYNMVRRYGWTIAMTKEDMQCSLGVVVLGFDKPLPLYTEGNLCEGMYTATAEAGARSEAAVDRHEPGRYRAILMAPLHKADFTPDVICIYGNSAQVMRLVQAALWHRGGKLTSSFGGRLDCSDIIVTPASANECNVILPCSGDRIFAQVQDHEMAFSIPYGRLEEVLEGLRETHKAGHRYPTPSYLRYEAKFPEKYMALFPLWEAEAKGKQ